MLRSSDLATVGTARAFAISWRGERRDSEVHSLADRRTTRTQRRGLTLILAAMVAALTMVIAAPAQAHVPYGLFAWGQNGDGTLGDGGGPSSNVPVVVGNLSGVTAVASERGTSFYGQALALLENGTVWGWGDNGNGQVGDGTTANKNVPVAVCAVGQTAPCVNHLSGVKVIAAGNVHSLAVLENGTVVEWGSPGDGSGGVVPVAKSGLSGVKAIAGGAGDFSLALLENGTVMAWGANGSGQLGNGGTTSSNEPVAVCAVGELAPCVNHLSHVKAIAAGVSWGLAVLENGTVVSWGADGEGQLGNGTVTSSSVPVAVCAVGATSPCSEESKQLKGVKAVEAGQDQSLALLENGTVMAWGGPDLGNGTSTNSTTPVAVCAAGETAPCANHLSGVTAIGGGGEHPTASYALLESGKVMSWGDGSWNELGDGSSASSLVPVAVCAAGETAPCAKDLSGIVGIAAGDEQGFAIGPVPPTVTAISPKGGPKAGGTSVSITGTHFSEVSAVKFGSADAASFTVNSETSITAVSPPASGFTVDVTVTNPNGTSAKSSADQYTYVKAPPAGVPEIGRCVKVATGAGVYGGANCTTVAKVGKGTYEWTPVSQTEKQAFSGSGLETILTTVGHSTIKCLAANFSGEWTAPKTASVTVEFQGCYNAQSQQCQTVTNPQNKSEIKLTGVAGELGFIKHEIKEGKLIIVVGLDLKPQSPLTQLAEYECTGSKETGHIEGSVIGRITPVGKMTTASNLLYSATKAGEQRPEAFQGGPKDTLTTKFTSGIETLSSGASSLNIKSETGNNAAPLEIKVQ
jgi:hypothetical protein